MLVSQKVIPNIIRQDFIPETNLTRGPEIFRTIRLGNPKGKKWSLANVVGFLPSMTLAWCPCAARILTGHDLIPMESAWWRPDTARTEYLLFSSFAIIPIHVFSFLGSDVSKTGMCAGRRQTKASRAQDREPPTCLPKTDVPLEVLGSKVRISGL